MPIDPRVRALFNASVVFHLGNGERISFWKEPWHNVLSLQNTYPALFEHSTRKNLTVAQALLDKRWVKHLKRNLTAEATREFAALWEEINHIELGSVPDTVSWRWATDGVYTARSAYAIEFEGCSRVSFQTFIWKSDAPGRCKIFGWLALLRSCNTADVLARKGWPHGPACVLCSGPLEDVVHLLASCPYAIEVWRSTLRHCDLPATLAPSTTITSLLEWTERSTEMVPANKKKAWSSLVQLVWWTTWKERNARIFQNNYSSTEVTVGRLIEEAGVWTVAGRRSISSLMHRPREPD